MTATKLYFDAVTPKPALGRTMASSRLAAVTYGSRGTRSSYLLLRSRRVDASAATAHRCVDAPCEPLHSLPREVEVSSELGRARLFHAR